MMTQVPKSVQKTIDNLRRLGIRIDIIATVDRDVELFRVYKTPQGKEKVKFLAEINEWGRVKEYGPGVEEDVKYLQNPPRFVFTEKMKETVKGLREQGVRFNIMVPVDMRLELFYHVRTELGQDRVIFICEIDGYGQIQEWGEHMRGEIARRKRESNTVYNADGDAV